MVVLSACETAMGKQIKGEGNLSLARAYFQAGAKSVIASLWAVNDESTARIMIDFYKYLGKGKRKDEALQQAKLDYLAWADPAYQHPYYWAGFIAIGDMSPLTFAPKYSLIWWGVGILIVLLLSLYYWKYLAKFISTIIDPNPGLTTGHD